MPSVYRQFVVFILEILKSCETASPPGDVWRRTILARGVGIPQVAVQDSDAAETGRGSRGSPLLLLFALYH